MLSDEYELRSLQSTELTNWCDFCSESFSEKLNPPPSQYFLNHFNNDPAADLGLIFIAYHKRSNKIASTVRLFDRKIFSGNKIISLAGIGEVCTSKAHRQRGLSKHLLKYCLNVAREMGFKYSFLHADEWIRSYYGSFGYMSVPINWLILDVPKHLQLNMNISYYDNVNIQKINICDYTSEIFDLASVFSNQFNGPMERSFEYTSKWIVSESLQCQCYGLFSTESNKLISYAIYKKKNESMTLFDFATKIDSNKLVTSYFLLRSSQLAQDMPSAIKIPSKLVNYLNIEKLEGFLKFSALELSYTQFSDSGWMILNLNVNDFADDTTTNHIVDFDLYWPIDSF